MRIKTTSPTGEIITVFNLTDRSMFANNEWDFGQVEVYARSIIVEVDVTNTFERGWVALDEILRVDGPACVTEPAEATVSTIQPDTTTPFQPETTTPGLNMIQMINIKI